MHIRRSFLLLTLFVSTVYGAPEAELQKAAKPLTDFAAWCGSSKAKSVGEKAIADAKSIVESPADLARAEAALKSAADGEAGSATVADRRAAAYESAAAALQALSAKKHSADTDDEFDDYLIKAVEFSPQGRVPALTAAMQRALAKDRLAIATRMYAAVAVEETSKKPLPIEARLAADGKLAETAATVVDTAVDRDRKLSAAGYLSRLATVDAKGFAAGSYQASIDKLAGKPFLVHAANHPMAAWVAIPKTWDPAKKTPILFCIPGTGNSAEGYEGHCNGFRNNAKEFVVVCCVTLSNMNSVSDEKFRAFYSHEVLSRYTGAQPNASRLQFDLPGIQAVYKVVHDATNTEEQMYLTGFSGGGNPCYALMLSSPALIAAAAPACPNYFMSVPAAGRGKAPVQIFLGEKDPNNNHIGSGPGLVEQTKSVIPILRQAGYQVAESKMVDGVAHNPMIKEVCEYFDGLRKK
jgi:hypothetical protein